MKSIFFALTAMVSVSSFANELLESTAKEASYVCTPCVCSYKDTRTEYNCRFAVLQNNTVVTSFGNFDSSFQCEVFRKNSNYCSPYTNPIR